MVCWMDERSSLRAGRQVHAQAHDPHGARRSCSELTYRLDVNTLHRDEASTELALNEIGRVALRTQAPLFFDEYRRNRTTGSFILVDEATNATVAAGMILGTVAVTIARTSPGTRARRPRAASDAGRDGVAHRAVGVGQVDGRRRVRAAAGRGRPSGLRARRRQRAPRPQRRPRLLRRRTAPRTCAASATSPGCSPTPGSSPSCRSSARTAPTVTDVRGAARRGRAAVRRGVRRHADRAVRAARPEGPLRQGEGRGDHRLHRDRRSVRGAGVTRSSCSRRPTATPAAMAAKVLAAAGSCADQAAAARAGGGGGAVLGAERLALVGRAVGLAGDVVALPVEVLDPVPHAVARTRCR